MPTTFQYSETRKKEMREAIERAKFLHEQMRKLAMELDQIGNIISDENFVEVTDLIAAIFGAPRRNHYEGQTLEMVIKETEQEYGLIQWEM